MGDTGADKRVVTPEEQVAYAAILEKGMYVGLLILFVTFAIYVFQILPPAVPLSEIANYWSQPVHSYLEAVNHNFLHLDHVADGWTWLTLLGKGDFINFIGVAVLAGVTILCYLVVIPVLLKKGDKVYVALALAEVVILSLAASGLLKVGH